MASIDIGAIIGQIVGGGVGGAILTVLAVFMKWMIAPPTT
jgi:hypothetical protein